MSYWNPKPGRPYVWGVLPNEIVAIDVKIRAATYRVRVRRNVFYFQLPLEIPYHGIRLVATYRDGTTQAVR